MNLRKWFFIFFNLLVILIMWIKRDLLFVWLSQEDPHHLPILFIIITVLAIFPVVPFGIVGGIIGAKYGVVWGSVINITASTLAAVIVYAVTLNIFHAWGNRLLKKYPFLDRLQSMIKLHLFWTIIATRMVPIFPAIAINIYAGVFKLQFKVFVLATLLGKIPAMLVFAYVGNGIWNHETNWIKVVLIYAVSLLILFLSYKFIVSKKLAHEFKDR